MIPILYVHENLMSYNCHVTISNLDRNIHSTALLQRAWIEFERHHLAERSALQLQALLDQHTTRLSITQVIHI